MLQALTRDMAEFGPVDQHGLMRDNLSLAEAGYQPYGPAIDLLAAIPTGANPVVAQAAVNAWKGLYDRLDDAGAKAALASRVSAAWQPRLRTLGFEAPAGETLVDTELRATLIGSLGEMGDPLVAAEATRRLALLESDKAALDGPLKQTWLGIIARNANAAQWDFLRRLAAGSATSVERNTFYTLLGAAKDEALAKKALDVALSNEVSATNGAQILRQVAGQHPDLAFDFALANRARVETLVDDSARPAYLSALAATSKDPAMVGKLERLREATPDTLRAPVNRALARLNQRLATEERIRSEIAAWLDASARGRAIASARR